MSAHCHGHSVPAPEITPEQWTKIDSIIEGYRNVPGNLMPVLQAVQEAVGCLPPAVQDRIAAGSQCPRQRHLRGHELLLHVHLAAQGQVRDPLLRIAPLPYPGLRQPPGVHQGRVGRAAEPHQQGRSVHPGENRLPGGLRGGPGHADQRSGARQPHQRQDQTDPGGLPGREGPGV